MNSLYDVLLNRTVEIDGHIHLFNWDKPIDLSVTPYSLQIGFMDIEYDKVSKYKKTVEIYDDYIKNYHKPQQYLLATGITSEDIIEVYNKHKDIIKGFGELKCYDMYESREINYKKIKLVRDICKFSSEHGNLPVYVHWGLNEKIDVIKLTKVIKDYPTVPIVLCHCGIDRDVNFAYNNIVAMMNTYSNLWADVTYKGLDFFVENPMLLSNLPKDRLFFGSDLNNKNWEPKYKPEVKIPLIINNINKLKSYIASDNNLKRLFHIKY